jgi:hypothetical protein
MSNTKQELKHEQKIRQDDYECPECGGLGGEHQCRDCETDITEKECKEYGGLCQLCLWAISH